MASLSTAFQSLKRMRRRATLPPAQTAKRADDIPVGAGMPRSFAAHSKPS